MSAREDPDDLFVCTPFFPDLNAPPTLRGFISPSPSSSVSQQIQPPLAAYFKGLQDAHQALCDVTQDYVPPSRPASPSSEARSSAIRDRAIDAFNAAGGDPSHGKWAHVCWVLRLGCTRGRFLVPSHLSGKGASEGQAKGEGKEWVLANTEKEWFDAERRWAEEERRNSKKERNVSEPGRREGKLDKKAMDVKEKVRGWQARVHAHADIRSVPIAEPLDDIRVDPHKNSTKPKAKRDEVEKDPSPLGFPVVKRSSARTINSAIAGKKSKGSVPPKVAVHFKGISQERSGFANIPQEHPIDTAAENVHDALVLTSEDVDMAHPTETNLKPSVPDIADLSEMSFLPPSFPSQLKTSTPQPDKGTALSAHVREKPPPIEPVLFPSSPSSSPRLSNSLPTNGPQVDHPANTSSSHPLPSHSHNVQKRARPLTPPSDDVATPALKKGRMGPVSSAPPATTPPRSMTPPKSPTGSIGGVLGNALGLPVPSTPDRQLPTLTALLASSRRSKPRPRPPSRKAKSVNASPEKGKGPERLQTPERDDGSPAKSYFSSPASGSSQGSLRHPPLRLLESPMFSQHPSAFLPNYMSTQPPLDRAPDGAGSTGGGLMRKSSGIIAEYNSQFDLERNVDHVNELLERDVDYDVWIKDMPEEVDELPGGSQPANFSQDMEIGFR